jgi:predicted nucleotidyltransferase
MTAELTPDLGTGVALNERERRVLAKLLDDLRNRLGDDLLAIWLYGSRARGEADAGETDPDLRSDVDLMAIVDPARDARQVGWEAMELIEAAADAEGDSPVFYSLRVFDTEYLRDRRRIHSFFLQEVDRDKVVLLGSPLEEDAAAVERQR